MTTRKKRVRRSCTFLPAPGFHWLAWPPAIAISPMAYFHDVDHEPVVFNRVDDAIDALTNPIAVSP